MTTDGRHLLNSGKLPLISPELLGEIIASAGDLALLVSPTHRVVSVLGNRRVAPVIELNHADRTAWEFPVRYSLHRIGSDDSVLMVGRDLRPIAEVQQQLISAQLALERDYEAQREADTRYRVLMEVGRDPIVIVSMSTGRITDLNPAAAGSARPSRRNSKAAGAASSWKAWPIWPSRKALARSSCRRAARKSGCW